MNNTNGNKNRKENELESFKNDYYLGSPLSTVFLAGFIWVLLLATIFLGVSLFLQDNLMGLCTDMVVSG